MLCSAFDLIEHECSRSYTHPDLPNDAIQYIDCYGMKYLSIYGVPLYRTKLNKIHIQFSNRTETIPNHDDLVGNCELTYVYRFTKYLIRVTEAPFDHPFIGMTNDIMLSIDYFMDKIHRDHSCLVMISMGHYTKTVFYGNKMLDYANYLEYCLDGKKWEPMNWKNLNCKQMLDEMLLNKMVITRDGVSLRFNVNKFLSDLDDMGTLTKRANS